MYKRQPLDSVQAVASKDSVLEVQQYLSSVSMTDQVLDYLISLCEETRKQPAVELGVSPRGVLALTRMARAHAVLEERAFVTIEDVQEVFVDTCAHRLVLRPQARVEGITETGLLQTLLRTIRPPEPAKRRSNA